MEQSPLLEMKNVWYPWKTWMYCWCAMNVIYCLTCKPVTYDFLSIWFLFYHPFLQFHPIPFLMVITFLVAGHVLDHKSSMIVAELTSIVGYKGCKLEWFQSYDSVLVLCTDYPYQVLNWTPSLQTLTSHCNVWSTCSLIPKPFVVSISKFCWENNKAPAMIWAFKLIVVGTAVIGNYEFQVLQYWTVHCPWI